MNLKETELCLGLPGGTETVESPAKSGVGNKRGFSETVDLKLNLQSNKQGHVDLNTNGAPKEKTFLKDPSKPPAKAQVVGWPSVRNYRKNVMANQKSGEAEEAMSSGGGTVAFVKVSMDGAPYLRKVDLKMYTSYKDLSDALAKMFSSFTMGSYGAQGMIDFMNESKVMDLLNSSEYVPSYEDKDGDWMLVGDVPWPMFVESCKRLRIMKGSEAIGLAPRAMEKFKNRSSGMEARKTKKKIKGIQQATAGVSQDTSENPNKTIVPAALPQLTPTLVSLLEVIEPEVLYAGYDSSVPDSAWRIMTTLNMLGGRQVIAAVKWAKAIPGFRNLHLDDQMTLLQYSWMFLMAFALGWRSYRQSSGNLLCFAPDLIINEQRMSLPCMYDQCKHMLFVSSELQRLQVSYEEYLCMKTLLLLSSVPKEGLKSQELFDEIRMTYIKELGKAIVKREGNSSQNWQRFYQLTKLLDSMHEVVENLLTYCFQTFLDKTMSIEFPEMLAEIITNQIPKYSNGNIKKLLFHQK